MKRKKASHCQISHTRMFLFLPHVSIYSKFLSGCPLIQWLTVVSQAVGASVCDVKMLILRYTSLKAHADNER